MNHDIDVAQIILATMRSLPSTFLSSRTLKVGWEFCGKVQTEGAKNNKRKLKQMTHFLLVILVKPGH